MKKILFTFLLLCLAVPAFAAETAKVKIGSVKASINEDRENESVTVSQAGNVITVGYTFSRTKIAGLNTKSTTVLQVIQFEIDGELESGKTFEFDSNTTTPIITAVKVAGAKVKGFSTTGELSSAPVATGKLIVKSFDPATGEITANFSAVVSPISVQKGTKIKESTKGVKIKAKINAIVD